MAGEIYTLTPLSPLEAGVSLMVDKAGWIAPKRVIIDTLLQRLTYDPVTNILTISDGNVTSDQSVCLSKYNEGYINGFALINNSNQSLTIGVGKCRDLANSIDMELTAAITKGMTSWAEGDNMGGLDIGIAIVPNRTYYIYLIYSTTGCGDTTPVTDVIYSLSPTAPTLPTNYDYYRLIGSFKTPLQIITNMPYVNEQTEWMILYEHGANRTTLPEGYLKQPTGYYDNPVTTNFQVSNAIGRDYSNAINIIQNGTIEKSLSTWAEGQLHGAFTNAKAANKLYRGFLFLGDDGKIDFAFDDDAMGIPTLPSGYSYYLHVLDAQTDNSGNLYIYQINQNVKWITVTDNYTIGDEYVATHYICNKATSVALTLPFVASSENIKLTIKNLGAGNLTITPQSGELIDALTNFVLTQYDSIDLICDGTKWVIN